MKLYDERRMQGSLIRVLSKHFEGINDAEVVADTLISEIQFAEAIQKLNASDIPPSKDTVQLAIAVKALDKATEAIEALGYHGAKDLGDVVQNVFPNPLEHGYIWPDAGDHARDVLAAHLAKVRQQLANALEKIDAKGMSLNTAFGEGPEFEKFSGEGKQHAVVSRRFAIKLAEVYNDKTGRRPTVNTKAIPGERGHQAYGPFLELVRDAFEAVGVNGSPETWARNACKSFKDFSA